MEQRKGEEYLCKDILHSECFTLLFFLFPVKFRIVSLDDDLMVIKKEVSITLCFFRRRSLSMINIERLM